MCNYIGTKATNQKRDKAMQTTIQINNSFDWDSDIQTEDFLFSLGSDISYENIPNSPLAIVRTDIPFNKFKEMAKSFGISLSFIISELN
jgi:hypothetical protein